MIVGQQSGLVIRPWQQPRCYLLGFMFRLDSYGSDDCQYSDYYAADDACPIKAANYPAKQNPDTDNGYGPT
jgi:hypothetical protein